MEWLLIGIVTVIAALFGYKQWGASIEKKKQAKRAARDRERDAEISSRPNVSDPLDRM